MGQNLTNKTLTLDWKKFDIRDKNWIFGPNLRFSNIVLQGVPKKSHFKGLKFFLSYHFQILGTWKVTHLKKGLHASMNFCGSLFSNIVKSRKKPRYFVPPSSCLLEKKSAHTGEKLLFEIYRTSIISMESSSSFFFLSRHPLEISLWQRPFCISNGQALV